MNFPGVFLQPQRLVKGRSAQHFVPLARLVKLAWHWPMFIFMWVELNTIFLVLALAFFAASAAHIIGLVLHIHCLAR